MTPTLEVVFFGHAAVGLTGVGPDGRVHRVLIDPYEPGGFGGLMAYPPIDFDPTLILVSHDHVDHGHTAPFAPCPTVGPVQWASGTFPAEADGLGLGGALVDHDAFGGRTRGGRSWMMRLTLSGLTIGHTGDVGELPEQGRLEAYRAGGLDLLFVACGGYFTLGAAEAAELTWRLTPRLAVPIHYRTEMCGLEALQGPELFVERFAERASAEGPLRLTDARLDRLPPVVRLAPGGA